MAQSKNATLVVRVKGDAARIWTGAAPQGTQGATTLTDAQSEGLRKAIAKLDKSKFGKHQTALKAGRTVKARGDGQVAAAINAAIGAAKGGKPQAPAKQAQAAGVSRNGLVKGSQEAKDRMAQVRNARKGAQGSGKPQGQAQEKKAKREAQRVQGRTKSDLARMTKAELIALLQA